MIHSSLFNFNFRRITRKLCNDHFIQKAKCAMTAIVSVVLFIMCVKGLNYLYVREDEWSRKMFYDYYNEQDNIDNLFVGSSHVHWDINPTQLDGLNNMNNFNLSISDERLDTAYYLIKEASRKHKLTHIYLEMYYYLVCGDPGNGDLEEFRNKRNGWRATDYMKWSSNKLAYMIEIGGIEKALDTWIPFVRYRERLFDTDYVREIVSIKQSEEHKNRIFMMNYEDDGSSIEYQDKGYVCGTREIRESDMRFGRNTVLGQDNGIAECSEEYLRKIIEYCQRQGIGITLISSPVFDLQLLSTEDYDSYVEQISGIAEEYGIPYYDFNLIKPKYLDIQKKEYFANVDHLTSAGASLYTSCLWKIVSGRQEDNQDFFCQSYHEKLLLESPCVYGYYYWNSEESVCCKIASNREEGMEYRILVEPEGMEQHILQDFSMNKGFELPKDEHGCVTIEARMVHSPNETQVLEIDY